MLISVRPELWSRFPGMRILVISGEGLDKRTENPKVAAMLEAAQDGVTAELLEGANITAWKKAYEIAQISMGKYPVSVRAMIKRIANGGRVPSINPLVDFYNAISIANASPLGGMDLDQLEGPQELRFAKDGETFQGICVQVPEVVQAGEICYADTRGITT
jgi:DNA/RNA-binding domain of Phe-tRNA-synthetase-like protein